jgi:prepilin-type N-terminal cleavage/methylation domain-containing protein
MNRLRKIHSNDSGFTLIELLLAIVIGAIVITVAINLYMFGQNTFNKSQDRVDAQAQLRLAMKHIKDDLSVATNVQIITTVPHTFDEDANYYFVQGNTLVLKEGLAEAKAPPGSLSLPGLFITFAKVPQGGNIVRVSMNCADGTELESDIFVSNSLTAEIGGANIGNTILFETIE